MFEQFHDVEEIARVLSIQRRNEFSSVNVFGCENWDLNVCEQGVAGHGRQVSATHAVNRAAHYRVDLDLYFCGATSNDQPRFTVTPGPRHVNRELACSQAIGCVSDSGVDSGNRFVPPDSVIGEDQI
jgi:hypothetical protein